MSLRTVVLALVSLGAGLAVYGLWPASASSPEDEIRLLVARAVAGAEKRDPAQVTHALADDFKGAAGMGKPELTAYVQALLLQSPKGVAVLNPSLEVTVDGADSARFVGTFVLLRSGSASESARETVEAQLARRDGQWVITSARWHQ